MLTTVQYRYITIVRYFFANMFGQSRELRVKCLRMGVVSERSAIVMVRGAFPASAATMTER